MPDEKPKMIAYLLGAGATHAELIDLEPTVLEKEEEQGLLIRSVSARVIEKASREPDYLKNLEMVSGRSGTPNVELLIGLIESSKIDGWESRTRRLKELVQKDIEGILTDDRIEKFWLHKALIELHRHAVVKAQEDLNGIISLNYDDVADRAFRAFGDDPNYCFSLEASPTGTQPPLLKLHGSFNWRSVRIRGRTRSIDIIPMGPNKSYLHSPYSFIWNRALEILIECDTLRVIGCSLSPNDAHLVDLLFRAHLEKGAAFDIEAIDFDDAGERIQKSYGFFPQIKKLTEIDAGFVPGVEKGNPFRTWLKYKGMRILKEQIETTEYVKRVME